MSRAEDLLEAIYQAAEYGTPDDWHDVSARLRAWRNGPKESAWQPIETAPKDEGKPVLLFVQWGTPSINKLTVGRWHGMWVDDSEDGDLPATHWMPLPEPPK